MVKGARRDCGVWEALRPLKQAMTRRRNHPTYVARGNEQPLLEELLRDQPPVGGIKNYVEDLEQQ